MSSEVDPPDFWRHALNENGIESTTPPVELGPVFVRRCVLDGSGTTPAVIFPAQTRG